jgi:4-hydroxybenzoate polyprenyltransferase
LQLAFASHQVSHSHACYHQQQYQSILRWHTVTNSLVVVWPAALAYFVAAMSPNMDVANAALPVYVSTLLYFGGFLFT